MSRRSKDRAELPWVAMGSNVIQQIHQHARSCSTTEVCGVLIGRESDDGIDVEACIRGLNAEQAGAHVTFTQDTWQHIYKVKDQEYPEQRILGWYHSHPGFGIFLSEHDIFIHKNFFSSPRQVAWVFDPHSEEEGCFGWVKGSIERLPQIRIIDRQGGEPVESADWSEPAQSARVSEPFRDSSREPELDNSEVSLRQLTVTILSHLSVLLLGFLIGWYVFPRIVVMPVPVDPQTGQPLELRQAEPEKSDPAAPNDQGTVWHPPAKSDKAGTGKEDNGQRR
jgi:proteasome lid subunit RPN8/RPN11